MRARKHNNIEESYIEENKTEGKAAGTEAVKPKKRFRLLPAKAGYTILLIVDLLVAAVFLILLTIVDALPGSMVLLVLVVQEALLILIWRLLSSSKTKTRRRIAGAILSGVFLIAFGLGSYYLMGAYSLFSRITNVSAQHEYFYVVAPASSPYETEEDIQGKSVFIVDSIDPNYTKAQTQLKQELQVNYELLRSVEGIRKRTIGEKTVPENLVFINKTTYELLSEENENFEDDTKILYTVKLEIASADIAKRANVTEEAFNIYISGIDVFGEIDQVSRSDVNMIVTVNPKTRKILLTSIPRDSYVVLHSYQEFDKLTHAGIYGIDESVGTVEDWLGLSINYYFRVNFTTLVDIVDTIGGIDVYSPVAFESYIQDYSYQQGMNHLGGREALYFARERHAFEDGDEARNQNQQRVLKAILDKVLSSSALLTSYDSLLAAIQDEMQTNMMPQEITALVKMQLADFGEWTIEFSRIHGVDGEGGTFSMGMDRPLAVSIPEESSVEEAKFKIDAVMNPSEEELEAVEEARKAAQRDSFLRKLMFWKK